MAVPKIQNRDYKQILTEIKYLRTAAEVQVKANKPKYIKSPYPEDRVKEKLFLESKEEGDWRKVGSYEDEQKKAIAEYNLKKLFIL